MGNIFFVVEQVKTTLKPFSNERKICILRHCRLDLALDLAYQQYYLFVADHNEYKSSKEIHKLDAQLPEHYFGHV